jgi:hypothetical protein
MKIVIIYNLNEYGIVLTLYKLDCMIIFNNVIIDRDIIFLNCSQEVGHIFYELLVWWN